MALFIWVFISFQTFLILLVIIIFRHRYAVWTGEINLVVGVHEQKQKEQYKMLHIERCKYYNLIGMVEYLKYLKIDTKDKYKFGLNLKLNQWS